MRRLYSSRLPLTLGIVLLASAAGGWSAEDYRGAGAVLRQLEMRRTAPPEAAEPDHPGGILRKDLAAFREKSAALPPQEAAREWLRLVDRYQSLDAEAIARTHEGGMPLGFDSVVAALPPPPAWNALAAAIQARQPGPANRRIANLSLLLLAHTLTGDNAAQWRDLAALEALAAKGAPEERLQFAYPVLQLNQTLAEQSADPQRILKGIEARLSLMKVQGAHVPGRTTLELPDLVSLVGPAKAEALLRRYLLEPRVEISISSGRATLQLARQLTLELLPKLKTPQWTLAHSTDAVRLYEALAKRFPEPKAPAPRPAAPPIEALMESRSDGGHSTRDTARVYYMLGLIAAGRTKEAAALLPKVRSQASVYGLSEAGMVSLEKAGFARALTEFLQAALMKDPSLPLWSLYISTAAAANRTGELLGTLRAALARPQLPAERRQELQEYLYRALLAADQVDEGAALLRKLLAQEGGEERVERVGHAVTLANLGHLLKKPEWVEEGVKVARETLAGNPDGRYFVGSFVDLMLDLGRGPEAEQLLIDLLGRAQPEGFGGDEAEDREILITLAGLYHRAGRHADVLTLLDRAPSWGATDLSAVLLAADERDNVLGYLAAAALAKAGSNEMAERILQTVLRVRNNYDPAYALLVELKGQEALPLLDDLAARDRFEERPLIWKAYLLLKAGRLEEAEKAAREAVSIDPSDGEQKFGRRMRVYAILADIREARGDQKEAALFRGAVRAIRMSEEADQLYAAGLLDRGIRLYKEALTHFADAYCIQSRLAVQLAQQGKHEEAALHYRRAFELMPDSFGRMETHCFGCEGVFSGSQAQGIAERVFQELVQKTPEKPQVHYLLGYLRESQERYKEALAHFKTAVAKDPDYINAWQHIQSLDSYIYVTPADRNAAALNLLRLDPLRRHVEPDLGTVSDLRALWQAVDAARKELPPTLPETIYPLAASKELIEKREALNPELAAQRNQIHAFSMMRSRFGGGYPGTGDRQPQPLPPPAEVLSEHNILSQVGQLIDSSRESGVRVFFDQ
ncbi:MAG: tetratricopeptide repeat protein [Armatimonadota bacterium]